MKVEVETNCLAGGDFCMRGEDPGNPSNCFCRFLDSDKINCNLFETELANRLHPKSKFSFRYPLKCLACLDAEKNNSAQEERDNKFMLEI